MVLSFCLPVVQLIYADRHAFKTHTTIVGRQNQMTKKCVLLSTFPPPSANQRVSLSCPTSGREPYHTRRYKTALAPSPRTPTRFPYLSLPLPHCLLSLPASLPPVSVIFHVSLSHCLPTRLRLFLLPPSTRISCVQPRSFLSHLFDSCLCLSLFSYFFYSSFLSLPLSPSLPPVSLYDTPSSPLQLRSTLASARASFPSGVRNSSAVLPRNRTEDEPCGIRSSSTRVGSFSLATTTSFACPPPAGPSLHVAHGHAEVAGPQPVEREAFFVH